MKRMTREEAIAAGYTNLYPCAARKPNAQCNSIIPDEYVLLFHPLEEEMYITLINCLEFIKIEQPNNPLYDVVYNLIKKARGE